ncbi:MAG: nucleotidyltransferase [Oscillospiraceae bacterium]|nr:nucleotidyltransferase [Oscillospiraceae bacterium]
MTGERTLIVLAAGIGSRFRDGIKQLTPVGPNGEVIMDYAIHDALEAGFNRIIFIIRHDIEELFESIIGSRIRPICQAQGVEVLLAYQEKTDLPGGYVCPMERAKPWGTGHALLSCRGMVNGGFAVINADDYYGKDSYRKASRFLDALPQDSTGCYGLVGFSLGNTLSDNGGVTRGLCTMEENGCLKHIVETKQIIKSARGASVMVEGRIMDLDPGIPVSMNMWAFTPDVLDRLEEQFLEFLARDLEQPKSEFLIPTEIGRMLTRGVRVQVLPTESRWFGMTFAEDIPSVREAFKEMTDAGIYPSPLH